MRIIFMGTPGFAVPALDILVKNGYEIVGVITAPDKPAGRGMQVSKSAVKEYAEQHNLKILQPASLKSEEFISELKSLKADLQIVVAFRMLPEIVWNMPPLGTYNVHASLLPNYRGAAPINWALINGENETGVTTFKLKHEIDTGNILFQEKIKITEDMNAGELHDKLMVLGADVLLKSVRAIESGHTELKEQTNKPADELKHAPKIFKEHCKIDWSKSAHEIHNLVRGLSPYPAAWTELKNDAGAPVILKIYKTTIGEDTGKNEKFHFESEGGKKLKAICGTGFLYVEELQAAGKKRMQAPEFLRGFKLDPQNSLC
jgi:methionyl-tRNA formyltransferase